jgi:hypothetical protein
MTRALWFLFTAGPFFWTPRARGNAANPLFLQAAYRDPIFFLVLTFPKKKAAEKKGNPLVDNNQYTKPKKEWSSKRHMHIS